MFTFNRHRELKTDGKKKCDNNTIDRLRVRCRCFNVRQYFRYSVDFREFRLSHPIQVSHETTTYLVQIYTTVYAMKNNVSKTVINSRTVVMVKNPKN